MEASPPTEKTSLINQVYRALVVPSLCYYALIVVYSFTLPEAEGVFYTWWSRAILIFVIAPVMIALGALVMRRAKGNVIGPALIVYACLTQTEFVSSLQVPRLQASLHSPLLLVGFLMTFLIITAHFPDGRFYPSRIAPLYYGVALLTVAISVLYWLANPLAYGLGEYPSQVSNLFHVPALARVVPDIDAPTIMSATVMVFSIALLLYRYNRAQATERKQIRWFVLGITITFVFVSPQLYLSVAPAADDVLANALSNLTTIAFMAAFPFAIGMGVLFHRLWDIDVIIRRTLIYSVVSVLLIMTYFGIVLAAQNLVSGFIPGDDTLLTIASTLVVAALFNPVLQRVQRVIDRLFYRKRYDAEEALEQFSEKIRDAVNVKDIEQHVLDAITSTMQPEAIGLWVFEQSDEASRNANIAQASE